MPTKPSPNQQQAPHLPVSGDRLFSLNVSLVFDRFLHHCHTITINGRSYRLKDRANLLTGGEIMP